MTKNIIEGRTHQAFNQVKYQGMYDLKRRAIPQERKA